MEDKYLQALLVPRWEDQKGLFDLRKLAAIACPDLNLTKSWNEAAYGHDQLACLLHEKSQKGYTGVWVDFSRVTSAMRNESFFSGGNTSQSARMTTGII